MQLTFSCNIFSNTLINTWTYTWYLISVGGDQLYQLYLDLYWKEQKITLYLIVQINWFVFLMSIFQMQIQIQKTYVVR